MSINKVQINICSYDEMLQIPTIGRVIAIRIWELRKVRSITPELLATIPYIKMEVVNQYIDYTSLDEFEFEDQDELDYEEQDDYVDDITTQAPESDKVLQHHGWLDSMSSFDKLRIADQKGIPVASMFKPSSLQFANINQEAPGVQPNDIRAKNLAPPNMTHPVTSTVHTEIAHEPRFSPTLTSTVGNTTRKTRKLSRQNVNPNRSDLPRPKYQNPFNQVIPQHQIPYSEPVYTAVTQFQPQTNVQFESPMVQNPIQPRVTPQFGLPSNLQGTLQGPDYSNVNMSRNFHKQTVSAPKSLKFDGTDKKENWVSFFVKFELYADAYQWNNVQKRAQLCWAMTGTAGKYCSAIIRREKNTAYEELVIKMEKCFYLRKLAVTVQVQFNNARQSEKEDIDEWVDRLLALADKAFPDLPDEYVTNQIVIKLCQGCIDKKVGSVAASFQPKTVEDALERIKLLQHSNQAIFGGAVRT